MKPLQRKILQQLIDGAAEPLVVARVDQADWPVVMCNPAFDSIAVGDDSRSRPLADVVEAMLGRDLTIDLGEAIRQQEETTMPVELGGREYLLSLKPLELGNGRQVRYCACYWRGTANVASSAADREAQQALQKAKRRIRDLSRDDPVSGLLNEAAFREILNHDWAVASREKNNLAVIAFALEDFEQYINVFGRHASDSCVRRVAQAVKRCLRRASDVVARIEGEGGDRLVVLCHGADEPAVSEFAKLIAATVRSLGLHHPRSSVEKFVTVSYEVAVAEVGASDLAAERFLSTVLSS